MSELNIITGNQAAGIFGIISPSDARKRLDKAGVVSFFQKKVKCYDRKSFDEKFPQYKGVEVDPATLETICAHRKEQQQKYISKKKNKTSTKTEIRSTDHILYQSVNFIHELIRNEEFDKVRNLIDSIEKYKESLKQSQHIESEIYKIIS